jgi:hypothetical protein
MSDRCAHEGNCGYEFCNGTACGEFKEEGRKQMLARVIKCEGYRAFRGTMKITPKAKVPSFELTGDWLYKPDTRCWYGKGSSFHEDICRIVEVQ